jgi:hypothetical protein
MDRDKPLVYTECSGLKTIELDDWDLSNVVSFADIGYKFERASIGPHKRWSKLWWKDVVRFKRYRKLDEHWMLEDNYEIVYTFGVPPTRELLNVLGVQRKIKGDIYERF